MEEEQVMTEDVTELEMDFEAPLAESGGFVYVCSECGSDLTEIPNYNRYYCENCGLHY